MSSSDRRLAETETNSDACPAGSVSRNTGETRFIREQIIQSTPGITGSLCGLSDSKLNVTSRTHPSKYEVTFQNTDTCGNLNISVIDITSWLLGEPVTRAG